MSVKGPADAERYRTEDQWHRRLYRDPLPPCELVEHPSDEALMSITGFKSAWKGEFKKKLETGPVVSLDGFRAATFVADQLPAINLLASDRNALIELVAGAPARDLNRAANRGTGVHKVIEDISEGYADLETLAVYNPDSEPYLGTVKAFVEQTRPKFLFSEYVVFNHEVGYGGTGDNILTLEINGKTYYVYWKSRSAESKHGAYVEEAAQIAAAARAEYIIIEEDGCAKRILPPPADAGLVVSIKPDGFEMYEIDLDYGFECFLALVDCFNRKKEGQKAGRQAIGKPLLFAPPAAAPVGSSPERAEPAHIEVDGQVVKEREPEDQALATVHEIFPDTIEVKETEAIENDPFAGLPDEDNKPQPDRAKITEELRTRAVALNGVIPSWPADVLTFREMRQMTEANGGGDPFHSVAELKAIEKAIIDAEAAVAAPFAEAPTSWPTVPKDDPRVLALVERVTAMTDAQRDKYIDLPPTGMKPSSGSCTFDDFELYVAAADKVLGVVEDVDDLMLRITNDTPYGQWFRRNDSGWVVDQPQAFFDLFDKTGKKREILKRARALRPGQTIRNADEVVADPALVAKILLGVEA